MTEMSMESKSEKPKENHKFLINYQELQQDIMFDKIIDLDFASVSYSADSRSSFWNNALTNQVLSRDNLQEIENVMTELGRLPAVYFENKEELKPLKDILRDRGYKKRFEDSWMFFLNPNVIVSEAGSVVKVSNEKELEEFLKTFDASYQKDDPQNPYGELSSYLEIARKSWHKHKSNNRLEYFTIYDKDEPVAVSTLTNFGGIGYTSNVGSIRSVRGKGFGKLATMYCIKKSQENGNTIHCLATEEGDYPNEFYKRLQFETLFTAVAFVKK
ncbi:hypothetical protein ACFL0F_00220 [Patescibacteria group bacterium]